jgi:dynein heavy chain
MTSELEKLANAMYDNLIPEMWSNVAYLSQKPLGGWLKDLQQRLVMLQSWLDNGPPNSFWISGFFFT